MMGSRRKYATNQIRSRVIQESSSKPDAEHHHEQIIYHERELLGRLRPIFLDSSLSNQYIRSRSVSSEVLPSPGSLENRRLGSPGFKRNDLPVDGTVRGAVAVPRIAITGRFGKKSGGNKLTDLPMWDSRPRLSRPGDSRGRLSHINGSNLPNFVRFFLPAS